MSTDQPTLSASNRSAAAACVRAADQAPPTAEETHRIGLPYLSILAFAVGIVTGLGAVAFRDLIGFVHNLLFLGQFVVGYDANLFTPPSPWGPFVILVPVIGALAVTFLVTKFAPEAQGHGVPEVMDAIYYRGGVIRPIVRVCEVARLGNRDRQRGSRWAGGPDHSNWVCARLDRGSDRSPASGAAYYARGGGRRRRYRRDFQYADWRGHVRG